MKSTNLQNPSDPEATYRSKAGKGHVGYALNVVEVRDVNQNIGLILSHEYQSNIHSDAEFGEAFVLTIRLQMKLKVDLQMELIIEKKP